MKNGLLILLLALAGNACGPAATPASEITPTDRWRLGWRMVENAWNDHSEAAEMQFDSLLSLSEEVSPQFLVQGIRIKLQLKKRDEAIAILSRQDPRLPSRICRDTTLAIYEPCIPFAYPTQEVTHEDLRRELMVMYVNDQAVRGNLKEDIIETYKIDRTKIATGNGISVDKKNRERLKEIIAKHGFPTAKMVGRDALEGVFFIIQHADQDQEWQQAQLASIESLVDQPESTVTPKPGPLALGLRWPNRYVA